MYIVLKILITALVVVGISEIGKRFSFAAGILASLPLTSILAFVWLYQDTKNSAEIINLSYVIFWMVIPSLFFFLALPFLLKIGWKFYPALLTSCLLMFGVYSVYTIALNKFGVKI
ncbi:MAG: DUF3147 family protein [Bacteriovorax sp.]|nr:DUF3147 family protein [Bacteriovorax sp.]